MRVKGIASPNSNLPPPPPPPRPHPAVPPPCRRTVSIATVYFSVFFTDTLVEALQDQVHGQPPCPHPTPALNPYGLPITPTRTNTPYPNQLEKETPCSSLSSSGSCKEDHGESAPEPNPDSPTPPNSVPLCGAARLCHLPTVSPCFRVALATVSPCHHVALTTVSPGQVGIHRLGDLIHKEFQELKMYRAAPIRVKVRVTVRPGFGFVPRRAHTILCARESPHATGTHACGPTRRHARTHTRTHARTTHTQHDHRQRHPPSQPPPPRAAFFRTAAVQPTPPAPLRALWVISS